MCLDTRTHSISGESVPTTGMQALDLARYIWSIYEMLWIDNLPAIQVQSMATQPRTQQGLMHCV